MPNKNPLYSKNLRYHSYGSIVFKSSRNNELTLFIFWDLCLAVSFSICIEKLLDVADRAVRFLFVEWGVT